MISDGSFKELNKINKENFQISGDYKSLLDEFIGKTYESSDKLINLLKILIMSQDHSSIQKEKRLVYPFVIQQLNSPQFVVHLGQQDHVASVDGLQQLTNTYYHQQTNLQYYQDEVRYQMDLFDYQKSSSNSQDQEEEKPTQTKVQKQKRGRRKTILKMPTEFKNIEAQLNQIIQTKQCDLLDASRVKKKRIRKDKNQKRINLLQGNEIRDTKNITKNFAKTAIQYILNNPLIVEKLEFKQGQSERFLIYLAQQKVKISNVRQLTDMLTSNLPPGEQSEFNTAFRKILYQLQPRNSYVFLKKHSISYIFNSRITQVNWHLIYRFRLMKAIKNPESFLKNQLL